MFQHRRLREKPATGGISVYCESMAVTPQLGDYATRLLRDMNWEGPAMVEFKWDSSNQRATLIEVNGRFWGSLPLALHAGVDFPAEYLRCVLDPSHRPQQPAYVAGLRCRSLWHDAAALLETWRTGNRPRVRATAGFLQAFSLANRGYVWDWSDQRPAWGRLDRFVPRSRSTNGVLKGRKGTI
jgi:predicted ATP-grasp superfamily ATP-dependent carboligase